MNYKSSCTVYNDSNYYVYIGVYNRQVVIVTYPPGIPVDGQPNTFDYPISTSVTLMCMVTAADGSPDTETSYRWTDMNCYTYNGSIQDPCFYSGNKTGQNITGNDLKAEDAGTVTCTATVGSSDYMSEPLTLRISGSLDTHIYVILDMYIDTYSVLQYVIGYLRITRITKNFEFKKGVGIEIKSEETRSKQKVRKQGSS